MSVNKTQATEASVVSFITAVKPDQKRQDAFELLKIMEDLSGYKAKMWGESIVGLGQYHYKYGSGREGDHMRLGFSPRKTKFSLYIMSGFEEYKDLLSELGKHKLGKSCLYINKLSDVKTDVLKKIIQASLDYMQEQYPEDVS